MGEKILDYLKNNEGEDKYFVIVEYINKFIDLICNRLDSYMNGIDNKINEIITRYDYVSKINEMAERINGLERKIKISRVALKKVSPPPFSLKENLKKMSLNEVVLTSLEGKDIKKTIMDELNELLKKRD